MHGRWSRQCHCQFHMHTVTVPWALQILTPGPALWRQSALQHQPVAGPVHYFAHGPLHTGLFNSELFTPTGILNTALGT
jgi:hypothetical protein